MPPAPELLLCPPVAPVPVPGPFPSLSLAYFSGWSSTMYILGMNRQQSVTVADRITHIHRLEIWICKTAKKLGLIIKDFTNVQL